MSFIFGGNSGQSYEDIQRQRKIASQLMIPRPRNAGEGLLSIADALMNRAIQKKADRGESKLKGQFNEQFGQVAPQSQAIMDLYNNPMASDGHKKVLGALMKSGVPGFSRGGVAPGGIVVVGENGPEVLQLPKGTKINPSTDNFLRNERQQNDPNYNPAMENFYRNEEQEYNPNYAPDPMNPINQIPQQQDSFDDAKAYRTADMSGIKPAGVGEEGQLNAAARSFQGFMKSLQDYESMFADGGSTAWPGLRKDKLSTAHRDLQMQMKELYNLGVLNGPDLALMEQILINPTTVGANVADKLDPVLPGNQDMEQRIPANISEVRRMMTNRTEPALQQLGIDPKSLMPGQNDPSSLSDEELLKMLGS